MESGFLLQVNLLNNCLNASFYPCFNGIRVLTEDEEEEVKTEPKGSFYPCFNGIRVLTNYRRIDMEYGIREFLSLF